MENTPPTKSIVLNYQVKDGRNFKVTVDEYDFGLILMINDIPGGRWKSLGHAIKGMNIDNFIKKYITNNEEYRDGKFSMQTGGRHRNRKATKKARKNRCYSRRK